MKTYNRMLNPDDKKRRGTAVIRYIYLQRAIGLAVGFICIFTVLYPQRINPFVWFCMTAVCLVWPHIAYALSKHSENPFESEKRNMLVDSFLFGVVLPMISFNLVPSATFTMIVFMNNASTGGSALFGKGILAILAGILGGAVLFGLEFDPETRPLSIYASLPVLILYPSITGAITYKFAVRLKERRDELIRLHSSEKTKLRIEAERASRLASLGELAAGVAHEINNPNGLILMNSSLVQRIFKNLQPVLEAQYREHGDFSAGRLEYSGLREEMPELLSGIVESARKIKHIVEDLKDFARPSDEVHQEHLDLNGVVETAVRLAGNTIKNSTEKLVVSYGDNLPKVKGNFQSLEQVVVNLIVNSCQALTARDKGIFVSTSAEKTEKGVNVLVAIRDEGVGVSEQNLPHITDPFFTTKRNEGGTGLGLSVSARIVKDHGGHLTFTSKKGAGMTATISLPAFEEI